MPQQCQGCLSPSHGLSVGSCYQQGRSFCSCSYGWFFSMFYGNVLLEEGSWVEVSGWARVSVKGFISNSPSGDGWITPFPGVSAVDHRVFHHLTVSAIHFWKHLLSLVQLQAELCSNTCHWVRVYIWAWLTNESMAFGHSKVAVLTYTISLCSTQIWTPPETSLYLDSLCLLDSRFPTGQTKIIRC